MMRFLIQTAVNILALAFFGGYTMTAGQGVFRVSDQQVVHLLSRLDTHVEGFRQSLDRAVDRSFLHDAEIGRYLKQYAWEFEQLTDRMKERSRDRKPVSSEVQEVLNRGQYLETFMSSYDFGPQAERDWQLIYADLSQLADYYRIETYWGVPTSIGSPVRVDLNALANRLIGTYELDKSRSDDVREAVERAVSQLPHEGRRRVLTTLVTRLRVPQRLAIDRHMDEVTMASSLQPARVYSATGRAHTEHGNREAVSLYGDQFRLNTFDEDGNFYSVTYATIEQGARMQVIHTALLGQFERPMVIVSFYRKISDTPQLKLGTEEADGVGTGRDGARKKPRL